MRIIAQPAFVNRASNPYNWLLYTHIREFGVEVDEYSGAALLRRQYSIWHLHWPEVRLNNRSSRRVLARILSLRYLLERVRRRGTKVVWTVHNLNSHEQQHPRMEKLLWRTFLPMVDGFISLSDAGRSAATVRFPQLSSVPAFIVPTGHYRGIYPNEVSREQARAALNIPPDMKVIAFVGLIRQYKNIPHLIRVFNEMADPDTLLLVQGRVWWPETAENIRRAAGSNPQVRLKLDFVPDDRLQVYLNAADLVVLPFTEILNSGSALLALSYDRPIMVPDLGAMAELKTAVGGEWVRTYRGELNGSELRTALDWALQRSEADSAPLDLFSWGRVAGQTAAAYRELIG
ncbi:GDP-mannose--glycolipid 4-beta-D-mannosyltransferase [soil metagenome]